MKTISVLMTLMMVLTAAMLGAGPAGDHREHAAPDDYALGFTLRDIDGKDVDLSQFKGKVVLMVNTASECGYTPQYKGLEALYQSRKDRGLVILAFPANDFGRQEPGDAAQIKKTCHDKYKVTFPVFEKISVKGPNQHPLYKRIASLPAPLGGDPKWNFTKFVLDRSGRVVARFEPKVSPDDPNLTAKLDELLDAVP